jgi:hypothetical protein
MQMHPRQYSLMGHEGFVYQKKHGSYSTRRRMIKIYKLNIRHYTSDVYLRFLFIPQVAHATVSSPITRGNN